MLEFKMLIGGNWVDSTSGKTLVTVNPSTGEPFATVPSANERDVDAAVAAAKAAFPAWSSMKQSERTRILCKVAEAIRANAHEMATMEASEHGTPYNDAFGVVMGAAGKFEYDAYAAQSLMGDHIPVSDGTLAYFKRVPMGVAGLIIPWNLPTIVSAVKLAPALAVGNTCVLKPPSINSAIGLKFAEVIASVRELPAGVVNVVTGPGGSVGNAIAAHPDVDLIGFTGSSETGKQIMATAGATIKKCIMELGGKNPVFIMEDADLDAAIGILAWRQFNNSGQHCSGPGRYYVHEKVYDAFIDKFIAFAKSVKQGDPNEKDTFMGPMVSKEHQAKVLGYINKGIEEGAVLAYGGKIPAWSKGGFYIEPTILKDCKHNMSVAREEIFGPVAVIIKYTDADDLPALANDTRYALCTHIWTKDIAKGLRLADQIVAGNAFINCQMLTDEMSWGTSMKESGIGKEGGTRGIVEFTDLKMYVVNYGA